MATSDFLFENFHNTTFCFENCWSKWSDTLWNPWIFFFIFEIFNLSLPPATIWYIFNHLWHPFCLPTTLLVGSRAFFFFFFIYQKNCPLLPSSAFQYLRGIYLLNFLPFRVSPSNTDYFLKESKINLTSICFNSLASAAILVK